MGDVNEMDNMTKRIKLESRGKLPKDVVELNLDNTKSTLIQGLTDQYENLQILSLINVGLTTLKGFPNLPNLKKLELSDNRLSSGLNALHGCPNLVSLNLGGNRFKDIESLEPLKSLTNLKNLDLFNCEVTKNENYRQKLFALLPQLEFLDNVDKDGKEMDEDEDEYGQQDRDDDEEEEEEEEEYSDEENDEVGLSYLQKSNLENESEGEEFNPNEENEEDEDLSGDEDDEEEDGHLNDINKSAEIVEGSRGVKRKREEEKEEK